MQRFAIAFLSVAFFFSSPLFARDQVLVFAASSMTTALNQIVDAYSADTGNKVVVSYASSSALARQLAYGAPADIYISANEKWMDYAIGQGAMKDASVTPWVENQLVFVAEKSQAKPLTLSANDLTSTIGNSRLAIADPSHVPAGIYAKESLEALSLWATVENKLALSNSVRATLALVERGEAPLGIVYLSDAKASPQVDVVAEIPADSHSPIVFPKAMTKEASEEAEQFFSYLNSEQSQVILQDNGFVVLPSNHGQ